MAGSSFGTLFRMTTWGETHGKGVGVVVDGCPAGLSLCEEDIQKYLNRRKPGQSKYTTKRKEDDKYNIWNPETGLREKKYFCELEESFFEKEEWYLRLMLIGEDRLAHNLATRDRGRCISFNGISEDFEGMEDELMDVEERVNRQQIAEEMMSVLSDKQKKVVQEFYWNQKTHKQIAKENGVKRNAVTEILKYCLLYTSPSPRDS